MDKYTPRWQYTNSIVEYLMRIQAAREIVLLLDLPLDIEERLKKESLLKTVHYSTKIEGNTLKLEEVQDIIENRLQDKHKDAQEVRNYYNALLFLERKAAKKAKVTDDFICELHSIIEVRGSGRRTEKTPYRDGQNVIRDSYSGGIVYLPPEANDVPGLMKSLTNWIELNDNFRIPAPIKAAIAAYQLLTIHPFWDGNGRTARALATYILKRADYDLKGFYSLEEFYDQEIMRYYDSLQMGLNHNYYFGRNDPDLTPWLTYFLEIMVNTFEKVSRKITELYKQAKPEQSMIELLDKRQRWVANYILQKGTIKAKDVAAHFNVDEKTARSWLHNWVDEGFVVQKDAMQKRNIDYILSHKYLQGMEDIITGE